MNYLNFERKYQKNRFFRKHKKLKVKFGDTALILNKENKLELIYLSIIKYSLKQFLKKKKKSFQNNEKIWYFGKINFFLQKKSKNSRMGKGKGMLERGVMRMRKNFILLEFKGYSKYKLFKFLYFLNKKISAKFYLIFLKKTYNLWCNNNRYVYYFDKYIK